MHLKFFLCHSILNMIYILKRFRKQDMCLRVQNYLAVGHVSLNLVKVMVAFNWV